MDELYAYVLSTSTYLDLVAACKASAYVFAATVGKTKGELACQWKLQSEAVLGTRVCARSSAQAWGQNVVRNEIEQRYYISLSKIPLKQRVSTLNRLGDQLRRCQISLSETIAKISSVPSSTHDLRIRMADMYVGSRNSYQ